MKKEITIKSKLHGEFSSKVTIGNEDYNVVTELTGVKSGSIVSRAYLGGAIVSTSKTDYGAELADVKADKLDALLREHHLRAVGALREEKLKETKSPADYLKDAKALLRRKSHKKALSLLSESLVHHPDDPFLLSYYGCLTAVVGQDFETGIDACQSAIVNLEKKIPFGQEFFHPTLYLNLGRAFVAAGKKMDAIESFKKGLAIDPEDRELLSEMKKLGSRRKTAVPFLRRSNPINKYIGMLLHKKR